MREILFKAKYKGFEWVEGYLLREKDTFGTVNTKIYQIKGNGQFCKHDVDPDTVSEYTGKIDSNGRKIFENDIVRVHSHCLNESYIAVIKFGEYGDGFHSDKGHIGFYLEFSGDKNKIFRQDFGYWLEACKVEVIGNIFDNLELVEGTMNKTNAIQCESCTEQTKRIVFCDGKDNISLSRWICHNTECPYNDMAEKQKSATKKRKEAQEINRKNGVDVLKLTRLRIRAQLNLAAAGKIVGISSAQYITWEYENEPISVDKYNELLKRFKQEIPNQKCNNCRYFNGEKFCYWRDEETHENCVCKFWGRRYAR